MIGEKKIINLYQSAMFVRYDDKGLAYYFSADDFPGLADEPFSFRSSAGRLLRGHFYHYADPKSDHIVVFDHGMGGGHRSYMKEIERLARAGHIVFAYDHTGCMDSEGENTGGFARSLSDLNDALKALKARPELQNVTFSVMGHSWGGYACLNIGALHPDLTHIVALAGPVSAEHMIRQNFPGPLALYRSAIRRLETSANPDFVGFDAAKSLRRTAANVLIIQSDDDTIVKPKWHYAYLQKALADRPHTTFFSLHGKRHNPNYTADAVAYLNAYLAELKRRLSQGTLTTTEQKKAFVDAFDWNRMTAQDEDVWATILQTLAC